jgi:hypothetical protein
MNIVRSSATLSLALALTACTKTEQKPADSTAITTAPVDSTTTTTVTTSNTQTSPPTQPPGGVATPSDAWVITEGGIGKLRAGMTVAEAKAAVPGFSVPASRDSAACTYGKANSLPAGVWVMVEGGKVVRAEVRKGDVATSTGARIGDSEERIKTLYPNASSSPHKYTPGGHYLTVPGSGATSDNRIIFETDGKKVVTYRAGVRPQVEYVEGCG